jgi:hypothetical protein
MKLSFEQLLWMAGSWAGEDEGVQMEEFWTAPRGGLLLGVHRDVPRSGEAFFEYLRIEDTPEGIFYVAGPGGGTETRFILTAMGKMCVVFENPKHDFPQRITYWIDSGGDLHARVESIDSKDIPPQEWEWHPEGSKHR